MKEKIKELVNKYSLTELGKERLNLNDDVENEAEYQRLYEEIQSIPKEQRKDYLYSNDIALEDEDIELCINNYIQWVEESLLTLKDLGFVEVKRVKPIELSWFISETSVMYGCLFNGIEIVEGDKLLDSLETYILKEYKSYISFVSQKVYVGVNKYKDIEVAFINEPGQRELMRNKLKILKVVINEAI